LVDLESLQGDKAACVPRENINDLSILDAIVGSVGQCRTVAEPVCAVVTRLGRPHPVEDRGLLG
jgi:hypothetical protein